MQIRRKQRAGGGDAFLLNPPLPGRGKGCQRGQQGKGKGKAKAAAEDEEDLIQTLGEYRQRWKLWHPKPQTPGISIFDNERYNPTHIYCQYITDPWHCNKIEI